MSKLGTIYKLKDGTSENQMFLMLRTESLIDPSFIILYDNIENSVIGDSTKGVNIDNIIESSLRELSDFIVNNDIK